MDIHEIKEAIEAKRIRITDHADEEIVADKLSLKEVYDSVSFGEIIESYPTDRPYPSCLILGWSKDKEPIHSVWAYSQESKAAVLITVYRPDPNKWIEWRTRRK
ncbi:MAG: DUF4258 domain-containing protein [Nitrososphaera sp.]|nr:DUF4258 domain-containing protein [Nitrososphaera sp.]MCI0706774.1 DUF4258 domain-containing protein [Ignavibacteriota bacterium]